MRRSPGLRLACWLSFFKFGATAIATPSYESEVDGKMLLQKYCSRCHSIDATGQSPLQLAPPLREIYLNIISPRALESERVLLASLQGLLLALSGHGTNVCF